MEMEGKSQPNEAASIGSLPTSGSTTVQSDDIEKLLAHKGLPTSGSTAVQSDDIEKLVAHKGQGVLDEDYSPFDGTFDKNEAATEKVSSQPRWKKHKFILLGTASVMIIGAIILGVVFAPIKKESGNSSNTRVEGNGIDADLQALAEAPTLSPTAPPTVPPQWVINYLGMTADLGVYSVHDMVVEYEIGINRVLDTEILATDCSTPILGITLDLTVELAPKTIYLDQLLLNYNFDKSKITGSNIWNEATNQLQMCQIVRLVLPSETGSEQPLFVIQEVKRTLDINFDFGANFGIGFDVNLSPGEEIPEVEVVDP